MATSVATLVPLALTTIVTPANDTRLALAAFASGHNQASAIGSMSGVRPSGGSPLLSAYASGMNVTVNPGICVIQGTDNGTQGPYELALPTQATLTVATADATNPRWDLLIANIVDNNNGTSTYQVQIITGTPSSSPVDPAVGTNALKLARYVVPANATNMSGAVGQGSIQDLRQAAVAAGGISPVASSSAYPTAGPAGSYFHDLSTNALGYWDGSATHFVRSAYLRVTRPDGNGITSSNAAPVQITWNGTADMNQDFGAYPGSPLNFTLPFTGLWIATLHATFSANASGFRRVHVKQNSNYLTDNRPTVGSGDLTHCSICVPLNGNAGDLIGFWVDQNSGTTLTLSNQYASLYLVR